MARLSLDERLNRIEDKISEKSFRENKGLGNEEGKLCGDVNFEEAEKIVDAITPVPRGVGGVTTSILLEHVVDAAIVQNR